MIRAFAALALPDEVRADLAILAFGLPLPRVVPAENLHLTLLFLGELREPVLADVDLAFRQLSVPGFDLALAALGMFGGARPRAVYVGAARNPGLAHLQAKVVAAARGAGLSPGGQRFTAHVTLARLSGPPADRARLEHFVAARGDYAAPPFRVGDFRLYRSRLGAGGAAYEELARYPLA